MQNNFNVPEPSNEMLQKAYKVRKAASLLGQTTDSQRALALKAIADSISLRFNEIVDANAADLESANSNGLSKALLSRLKLNKTKLEDAIEGVHQVAALPDPIGVRQLHRELDQGLVLERRTVPLGVIGVIFEARPDVVIQIASLALRSGNGAILKGGREANKTNQVIMNAIHEGLGSSDVKPNALELLVTRQESMALLRLDGLVDLIIPRGSNELVRFIQDNTRIPVLGHADGICHLYIDSAADVDKALRIAIDSKTQYPAACNAVETLLVHKDIAPSFLKKAIPAFKEAGVLLRGDQESQELGIEESANESDWSTEYLDLTLAVKNVACFEDALEHITRYGSRHTEAIVTENKETAECFLSSIDSSGVYHNCSTRFADGFRYGFGAEVGISTQTLPPRGPVGLDGMLTYRYFLRGDGHIANDFANGSRQFSHINLPL